MHSRNMSKVVASMIGGSRVSDKEGGRQEVRLEG